MARTRSKPAPKKTKESTPEPTTSCTKPLPASTSNPPKVFILPKDTSKDARIVTLDNPATDAPSRYFYCPEKGFYEFTRIAAPKKECKSWLITGEKGQDEEKTEEEKEKSERIGDGYVTKSADMLIATPIDLLFLILPALTPKNTKDTKQHFLALEDYLDNLSQSSPHWRALLSQSPSLKGSIEKKMRSICDTVDAGDETMYRLSHDKLLAILLKKANRMVSHGLPPSLEEKFIKTPLEVPIMNIKREDSNLTPTTTTTSTTDQQPPTDTASQISTTTSTTTADSQDTHLTTPDPTPQTPTPALSTPPTLPPLLRLRTSLTYLLKSYLPPTLHAPLTTLTTPTFAPLQTHLSALAALKAEVTQLRDSRKRAYEDDADEERIAAREEKKRKKEEEERKKKSEGRGVKALRKVDVSGMKKMSDFFKKKA